MKQTDIQNKFRKKFLNQGVKMTAPETVFFSNDTKIGSVLKFWNWDKSFRTKRFFKIIK